VVRERHEEEKGILVQVGRDYTRHLGAFGLLSPPLYTGFMLCYEIDNGVEGGRKGDCEKSNRKEAYELLCVLQWLLSNILVTFNSCQSSRL
jgi:hypothetical protein